jgi:retron-type reverse transcriptase
MRLKTHMVDYYRREGHGADGWVLKGDVRHFFASIDHRKLKRKLKAVLDKRGVDPRVYELLCIYIDVMEDGLPLGYQTSQLFALMFLDEFDHIIKEKYRIKYYGRYMDDSISSVRTRRNCSAFSGMFGRSWTVTALS